MVKQVETPPKAPARVQRSRAKVGHPTKESRQQALSDVRRSLILDAATAVFFEHGLEGTSVREIARRAGYTPGAIYSYFASKEEVYGALLSESLDRLNAQVDAANKSAKDSPKEVLHRTAEAFFGFYRENPRDLDLGFYLFQGMQPRGLTPALNERLNERLRASLSHAQEAMTTLGMKPDEALAEVTALFAHAVGLLVLSNTGRIKMFKQGSQELFDKYLAQLIARVVT